MKKTIALSLAMAISFSANLLADSPESKPMIRKSKEIAVIKTVVGIICMYIGSGNGVVNGPFLIYDSKDRKDMIEGVEVSGISLATVYLGYNLIKNGFEELNEIAQYPDNNNLNQKTSEMEG